MNAQSSAECITGTTRSKHCSSSLGRTGSAAPSWCWWSRYFVGPFEFPSNCLRLNFTWTFEFKGVGIHSAHLELLGGREYCANPWFDEAPETRHRMPLPVVLCYFHHFFVCWRFLYLICHSREWCSVVSSNIQNLESVRLKMHRNWRKLFTYMFLHTFLILLLLLLALFVLFHCIYWSISPVCSFVPRLLAMNVLVICGMHVWRVMCNKCWPTVWQICL